MYLVLLEDSLVLHPKGTYIARKSGRHAVEQLLLHLPAERGFYVEDWTEAGTGARRRVRFVVKGDRVILDEKDQATLLLLQQAPHEEGELLLYGHLREDVGARATK